MTSPDRRPLTALTLGDAVAELKRWLRGRRGQTVAAVLGGKAADRSQVINLLLASGIAVPDATSWVRFGPDGITGSVAEPQEALADTLTGTAEAPAAVTLVIIDDLDELPQVWTRKLFGALIRLAEKGVRLLVGANQDDDSLGSAPFIVRIRPQFQRTRLLNQLAEWAVDRGADDVMVLVGEPGAGKSVLMEQAVAHLNAASGVQVPFAVLRSTGTVLVSYAERVVDRAVLFNSIIKALASEGVAPQPADVLISSATSVGGISPTTIGALVGTMIVSSGDTSIGALSVELDRRATRDTAPPVLVIAIDAINELLVEPQGGYSDIERLLTYRHRFPDWRLKVLLSSQYLPENISADTIELSAVADEEIQEYALTRLAPSLTNEALITAAHQVARLSNGLFLVADDLLTAYDSEGRLPIEDSAAPRRSAIAHVEQSLKDIRDRLSDDDLDSKDTIRLLTLAAMTPYGLTESEMAAIWHSPGPNGVMPAVRWPWGEDLIRRVSYGPARRYLRLPDPDEHDSRYRIYHPEVRQGVLNLAATDPTLTLNAERERFLRVLTPLDGTGPSWDGVGRRLAIATAPALLADLLRAGPIRRPGVVEESWDRQMGRVRRLIEDWRWLEACILASDDPSIPLGPLVAVRELGRLVDAVTAATPDDVLLWPDGRYIEILDLEHMPPGVRRSYIHRSRRHDGTVGSEPAGPQPDDRPKEPFKKKSQNRKYATMRHPTIQAAVDGTYRYADKAGALRQLEVLARYFVASTWHDYRRDPTQLVLFIKGFGLTERRRREGFVGYLARITTVATEDGWWTLQVEEAAPDIPLSRMPQRINMGRVNQQMPNWGHPILRRAKRNTGQDPPPRPYSSWDEAAKELQDLAKEFPNVSIPLIGVLYILVWDGQYRAEHGNPTRRILLNIVSDGRDGFFIQWRDNPKPNDKEFV